MTKVKSKNNVSATSEKDNLCKVALGDPHLYTEIYGPYPKKYRTITACLTQ